MPLTGAEPARRHVPATAACKAAALADMFEASWSPGGVGGGLDAMLLGDVPRKKRKLGWINGERINGLFHLLIYWGLLGYVGVITHFLAIY